MMTRKGTGKLLTKSTEKGKHEESRHENDGENGEYCDIPETATDNVLTPSYPTDCLDLGLDHDLVPKIPNFESTDLKKMGLYFTELMDYKSKGIIQSLNNKFYEKVEIDKKFITRDDKIASLELTNQLLLNRMEQMEIDANTAQQRERNYSVKILYMSTVDCKTAQDTIVHLWVHYLKPIYRAAVSRGSLPDMPSICSIVDWAHPLQGVAQYPDNRPIQISFCSRLMKDIFLMYNKIGADAYLLQYNIKPKIHQDYTLVNNNALNKLQAEPDVDQAWFSKGNIKFRLKASQDIIHHVLNPLASNLNGMTERPVPLTRIPRQDERGVRMGSTQGEPLVQEGSNRNSGDVDHPRAQGGHGRPRGRGRPSGTGGPELDRGGPGHRSVDLPLEQGGD